MEVLEKDSLTIIFPDVLTYSTFMCFVFHFVWAELEVLPSYLTFTAEGERMVIVGSCANKAVATMHITRKIIRFILILHFISL